MCNKCSDPNHKHGSVMTGRRELLLAAGAGLMTAPLLAGSAVAASGTGSAVGNGPYPATAYGVTSAKGSFKPIPIQRRALGPKDVYFEVLYCGICHSDIHTARNEWAAVMPTVYPSVPGHEIIGRVLAVGKDVTKFKVGDIGGVGCMVDSCGTCDNCLDDREQNCTKGTTFTYNAPDLISGGSTYGGYSDRMVVKEHFVIRIPPGVDLAATAPLLCAGITTFSPMQHWKLERNQRVGVIGLGGLGHVAVKLAVARQADVTVFTTTPAKIADAKRMGAKEAVLWSDTAAMERLAGKFDLLISTVPQAYDMAPFVSVLKLDATYVNVGALDQLHGINGMMMAFGRKSIAGSMIGGIAETQEVIDYCAARNIKADIELIRPDQIDEAYARIMNKSVRYRFVIDMTNKRAA